VFRLEGGDIRHGCEDGGHVRTQSLDFVSMEDTASGCL
jgi:hypothetical protein